MKNKKQKINKKVDFQSEVLKYLAEIVKCLSGEKTEVKGIPEKSPDNRFIDCGDGTIKDTKTGLMWQKEGSTERMTHEKAGEHCEKLSVGGHKDWRLPTVEELVSLVDYKKYSPAIASDLFKVETSWYWTSTIHAGHSGDAWIVYFNDGNVSWDDRGNGNFVRAVRQY